MRRDIVILLENHPKVYVTANPKKKNTTFFRPVRRRLETRLHTSVGVERIYIILVSSNNC